MIGVGAHQNVSEAEYDRIPGLRSTVLRKLIGGTPADARYCEQHGSTDTASKELGTMVHVSTLEPDRFEREYVQLPEFGDCKFKKNKATRDEWLVQNVGKQWIKQPVMQKIRACTDALHAHPEIHQLLTSPGWTEYTLVWDDPTGVRCKARLDRLTNWTFENGAEELTKAELKTGLDVDPWAFGAAAEKWGYFHQDAFYSRGLNVLFGEAYHASVWICVSTRDNAPIKTALYQPTEKARASAMREVVAALEQYAECRKSGIWPGLPTGFREIDRPAWVYAKEMRFQGFPGGEEEIVF